MMHRFFLVLFLLFMTACAHTSSEFSDDRLEAQRSILKGQTEALDFNRIVFFGDSFTDNESRLLNDTHGFIPTTAYYWKGRFSNGPVWSDYLTEGLGLPALNYAMAGARIKDKNSFGVPGDALKILEVPGADAQVDLFIKEQGRFQAKDLVFVWFGSNDYLFYADASRVPIYVQQLVELTEKIMSLGARRIVVMSLIPFDDVPLDPKGVDGKNFDRGQLEHLIDAHNQSLQKNIGELARQHPELFLQTLALGPFIRNIRKNAGHFGLTDLKDPCFSGGVLLGSNSTVARWFQSDKKPLVCADPRQHLFWDKAHPTTAVHCLAAVHVLDNLQGTGQVRRFHESKAEEICTAIP